MNREMMSRSQGIGAEVPPMPSRDSDFSLAIARLRELSAQAESLVQFVDNRTAGLRRPEPPTPVGKNPVAVGEPRAPIAAEILMHADNVESAFNTIRGFVEKFEI